jgi:hypothetical protein
MYWPQFDAAGLGNMLISSILAVVVAWVTTIITNRWDKEKQKEAWRRDRLIEERNNIREQIKELKVRQPPTEDDSAKEYHRRVEANPEWERPRLEEIIKGEIEITTIISGEEVITTTEDKYSNKVAQAFARQENMKRFHEYNLRKFPLRRDALLEALNKQLSEIEVEIDRFHKD